MNCENYQDLLSDYIDGSLTPQDHASLQTHLGICADCAETERDLQSIVTFCVEHRGEYDSVPNERALWLRISNLIEAEAPAAGRTHVPANAGWWFRLMNRSWQLTFPQLAASMIAVALIVSVVTIVGLRRFSLGDNDTGIRSSGIPIASYTSSINDRYRQQQQTIEYWNQRVELNKARWSQQMRDTFEQNLKVIDAAVNDSMHQLSQNPHDEVSEEVLNAALNDKVQLLKEFSEL